MLPEPYPLEPPWGLMHLTWSLMISNPLVKGGWAQSRFLLQCFDSIGQGHHPFTESFRSLHHLRCFLLTSSSKGRLALTAPHGLHCQGPLLKRSCKWNHYFNIIKIIFLQRSAHNIIAETSTSLQNPSALKRQWVTKSLEILFNRSKNHTAPFQSASHIS